MSDKVITAKLVRGKVYSFWDEENKVFITFRRAVPLPVTEKIAKELEALEEEVVVDEDTIARDLFEIDYDAVVRDEDEDRPRRPRMRLVAAETIKPKNKVKDVPVRAAPAPRLGTLKRNG